MYVFFHFVYYTYKYTYLHMSTSTRLWLGVDQYISPPCIYAFIILIKLLKYVKRIKDLIF